MKTFDDDLSFAFGIILLILGLRLRNLESEVEKLAS